MLSWWISDANQPPRNAARNDLRYSLAIQAMLQLPPEEEPLEAALILREDAARMGVSLPVKVQVLLLDESLKAQTKFGMLHVALKKMIYHSHQSLNNIEILVGP